MAWSLSTHNFYPFLLGAFWMGVAQGFSLFYRHEAAVGATNRRAGDGHRACVWCRQPCRAAGAEPCRNRRTLVARLLCRHGVACGRACSLRRWRLPPRHRGACRLRCRMRSRARRTGRAMIAPTFIGALAWFSMNLVMLAAPFSMINCGVVATGVMGAVAWHVVAMYAPAFVLAPLAGRDQRKVDHRDRPADHRDLAARVHRRQDRPAGSPSSLVSWRSPWAGRSPPAPPRPGCTRRPRRAGPCLRCTTAPLFLSRDRRRARRLSLRPGLIVGGLTHRGLYSR
jgi:hypothetical protein